MQTPAGRTTQPQNECRRASNRDVERSLHQCTVHDRQRVPNPIMGQTYSSGPGHPQPHAPVSFRPNQIRVRSPRGPIRLESIPPCTSRDESSDLRCTRIKGFMGTKRHRCMVPGACPKPLSLLDVLCPRNQSLSSLWLGRILSTTLPNSNLHPRGTHPRIACRIN